MEQMEEENPPSEFIVVVDITTFDEATISWAKPDGMNNENLTYAISLDNVTVAEEFSELSYTFEGLNAATSYDVEIVASNSFGATAIETSFGTLDPDDYNILLQEYKQEDGYLFNYSYNSDNLVIEQTVGNLDYIEYHHQITYDENNRILQANITEPIPEGDINYEYEGGELKKILASYFDGSFTIFTYTFTSQDSYEFKYLYDDLSGEPPVTKAFNITLQRNSENRIVEFRITNTSTQEEELTTFQYTNGNLTQINEVTSGIVWDVEYDSMNSFYVPGIYQHSFPYNYVGLMGFTFSNIRNIPDFRLYKNSNNPIRIKRNNVVEFEFEYEYYSHGYPSKIVENGSRIVELSYNIIQDVFEP